MTTEVEKKAEDWMTTKWRPMMAMTYMATIWFDFILGPILFNILQYYNPGQAITTWTPLTLQGGGLYHLAMGGILGIAAWTRGQEKIETIKAGEPVMMPVTSPANYSKPVAPAASGFGSGFAPEPDEDDAPPRRAK